MQSDSCLSTLAIKYTLTVKDNDGVTMSLGCDSQPRPFVIPMYTHLLHICTECYVTRAGTMKVMCVVGFTTKFAHAGNDRYRSWVHVELPRPARAVAGGDSSGPGGVAGGLAQRAGVRAPRVFEGAGLALDTRIIRTGGAGQTRAHTLPCLEIGASVHSAGLVRGLARTVGAGCGGRLGGGVLCACYARPGAILWLEEPGVAGSALGPVCAVCTRLVPRVALARGQRMGRGAVHGTMQGTRETGRIANHVLDRGGYTG